MREWNSYSDDLTIDGNVVKEYTIRFKTTEYEVYKQIEKFFQSLMDEQMDKCYKCRWWNYSYGCQNKKGVCEFESLADRKTEPQTDYRITGTIGYRCPKCGRGNFLKNESNCVYCGESLIKDEPQTDCAWGRSE